MICDKNKGTDVVNCEPTLFIIAYTAAYHRLFFRLVTLNKMVRSVVFSLAEILGMKASIFCEGRNFALNEKDSQR